ncbi:MAG: SusC/RagA family TonB-linked outer membrane protein [Limnohabitans sp.]|nr:SusC/RagA family TonB-linked outer membrane protein [Limnohabitans sp.]
MKKIILFVLFVLTIQVSFAQTKTLSGVVSDDSGPLAGVNISVTGTQKKTTSNFDGTFTIKANIGEVLEFSFIGKRTVTRPIENDEPIIIKLQDNSKSLSEVVVTSLGIKKSKRTLTYATQELKSEELVRAKDANLINTMTGKIAGVTINRSAGGTGGSTKVVIRGNSSLFNNQPLYVVDGIPLYNITAEQPNSTFGDTGAGNRDAGDIVSLINPEDIESISVLKGAAAAALYGSQGGRGVILLNTKKGTSGASTIRVSSTTTFENVISLPKLQNTYLGTTATSDTSWGSKGESKEYVKDFFTTGVTQTTAANFTGRTSLGATMLSFSNTAAKGVIPENSLNKNNLSAKVNNSYFDNKLVIGASVLYTNQNIYNRPVNGLYNNPLLGLYTMNRSNDFDYYKNNYEYYNSLTDLPTQVWNTIIGNVSANEYQQNPYWLINRNKSVDTNKFLNTALTFDYSVNKWLKLNSKYSYTNTLNTFDKKMYATSATTLAGPNGRYIYSELQSSQNYFDVIASINTKINDKLTFSSNIGGSQLKTISNQGVYLDSGFGTDDKLGLATPNWFTLANFKYHANNRQIDGGKKEIQSAFATANLGYNDYLFLDITARKDWSSALVNTNSTSFFYKSLGLTNILSETIKLPEVVTFAKVRASYGEVGNDIPSYLSTPVNTKVGGAAYFPNILPGIDNNYAPELKKEFEIGTEWRFYKNRFGIEVTYYNSKTTNQLFKALVPATVSSAQYFGINQGSIQNSGIELLADAKWIDTEKISWKTTVNFSKNKNVVTNIPSVFDGKMLLTEPGNNSYQFGLIEGQPFGVIMGQRILKDGEGRAILDATGKLQLEKESNGNTFFNLGNANPDFMLGIANSFKIGNFTANVLVDGRFGGSVLSLTESMNDAYGVSQRSAEARDNGGVTIPTVSATGVVGTTTFPAQTYYNAVGGRTGASADYIYDATNIVLREFSLGYTYKPNSKSFFDSASLSVIGRNLLFFYKKAPFDPNVSLSTGEGLQGVDIFGLPSTRSLGLNLNLTF